MLKTIPWTQRYLYIDALSKVLTQEAQENVYIHPCWVSFKDSTAKKKMEQMETPNCFSLSCCASTAAKAFRLSQKESGLFFVHTLKGKYQGRNGMFHATVLLFSRHDSIMYYYDPLTIQLNSLPSVACSLAKQLTKEQVRIIALTGSQKRGTVTCILHAVAFASELVKNVKATLDKHRGKMYSIAVKHY